MRKTVAVALVGVVGVIAVALAVFLIVSPKSPLPNDETLAAYDKNGQYGELTITYPLDESVFPPEIVPPTFRWEDSQADSDTWHVSIEFQDNQGPLSCRVRTPKWTPTDQQWESIKRKCRERKATVTVLGVGHAAESKIFSAGSISIRTSNDEVGAPIFYREVNLPFIDAVKDPAQIRWRFGEVSSKQRPPIVLEKLPVCGNCHSFSADGGLLGMDVDYANSKGSYAIERVAQEMVLDKHHIITWDDYKRDERELSFGLLSQVSPDGKYVISTVKDRSVFVPKPDLAFSQLFFPIKGILAVYRRETGTFHALPGADDRRFVHSNPTWSPDGKTIVFARNNVHRLKNIRDEKTVLLSREECREFLEDRKTFRYDLYRIPFKGGKGGQAEPLEGASANGMSNFFPRYSPDAKWIVFCKANSYMLLQPDSELYIIPAAGGKARRLRCNTRRMNSWHSWSPNGRWLVFSSKANSAYTQLFLTHIDQQGRSSPALLLSQFTAADRAANIPEFVNVSAGAIRRIREQFLDDHNYSRAGHEFIKQHDFAGAARAFRKAVEHNPNNAEAHCNLGISLSDQGLFGEAEAHLRKAVQLQADNRDFQFNLGIVLARQDKSREAIQRYRNALQIDPQSTKVRVNLAAKLLELGQVDQAIEQYQAVLAIQPGHVYAHDELGQILLERGKPGRAEQHFSVAAKIRPKVPQFHIHLARALAAQGQRDRATAEYRKVLSMQPDNARAHFELGRIFLGRKQSTQAETHFAAAIEIDAKVPDYHYYMGWSLNMRGQEEPAVKYYRRALELEPNLPLVLNNLAWIYSTSPNGRLRNGEEAVALIKRASDLSGKTTAAALDTLAAAYAETGQFRQAVETARRAITLAEQAGDAALAGQIRRRLDLYLANRPFRQSA